LDLQTAVDPSLRIGARASPVYLLLGLRYLKAYPKDADLCGFFGINSPETMTKWRNHYVDKLARLLEKQGKARRAHPVVVLIAPHTF
jgi:hypothetical protein